MAHAGSIPVLTTMVCEYNFKTLVSQVAEQEDANDRQLDVWIKG